MSDVIRALELARAKARWKELRRVLGMPPCHTCGVGGLLLVLTPPAILRIHNHTRGSALWGGLAIEKQQVTVREFSPDYDIAEVVAVVRSHMK